MLVCVCVFFGGGVLLRWEAFPPILLLLKSSHERPCQELQCGLSRLSQRQSRLHDATTHTHTADSRSFCSFCCSGHSARSGQVKCKLEEEREPGSEGFNQS
ncbi:hypothetical protein ILYODFUR_002754 [Ilyodon furcidens]|uniref:Secreted protein n=1 Tax=Ilyodon furcidens TaxID=33524 RepID=A0ABV0V1S5_9TELE